MSHQTNDAEYVYHDYSNLKETDLLSILLIDEKSRSKKNMLDDSFPLKLHGLLSMIDLHGNADIIAWQPHGRSFVVQNKHLFEKFILPFWFNQSKYTSFQRQLNLYGFRRITSGEDTGGYYHECFLREKSFLCQLMLSQKKKGKGPRKPATPLEEQPDFYMMPHLPVTKEDTCSFPLDSSMLTCSVAFLRHSIDFFQKKDETK